MLPESVSGLIGISTMAGSTNFRPVDAISQSSDLIGILRNDNFG